MSVPALQSKEVTVTWSPIGLQVIDTFLNAEPSHPYAVRLERFDGTRWVPSSFRPSRTPSGFLVYPGLERRALVLPGQPPQRYRVCIDSDFYIPVYRRTLDGREFNAFPYNDTHPPATANLDVGLLALSPSPAYGYPPDVRVLRGTVKETNGAPVSDAAVEFAVGQIEAMTDAKGNFALGLKRAPAAGAIAIDIHHDRTGRVVSRNVQLPNALLTNQTLAMN